MGILEDVVINAKSAANAVGKSATKLYDLSKLKVSAADLNGDINKHFEALGRIVYDGKQNGEDNSALIEDSVKIIKDLYESLAAINQQIDELKNLVKCPKCLSLIHIWKKISLRARRRLNGNSGAMALNCRSRK